jgi:hypothetical protein
LNVFPFCLCKKAAKESQSKISKTPSDFRNSSDDEKPQPKPQKEEKKEKKKEKEEKKFKCDTCPKLFATEDDMVVHLVECSGSNFPNESPDRSPERSPKRSPPTKRNGNNNNNNNNNNNKNLRKK